MKHNPDVIDKTFSSLLFKYNFSIDPSEELHTWNNVLPTQTITEFGDSWFKKMVDEILGFEEKQQDLALRFVEYAADNYVNLLEILMQKYPPGLNSIEQIWAFHDEEEFGHFLVWQPLNEYVVNLWASNVEKDSSYELDENLKFVVKNSNIKPLDLRSFKISRKEEFITQLPICRRLISKSDMKKIIDLWNLHIQINPRINFSWHTIDEYSRFSDKNLLYSFIESLTVDDLRAMSFYNDEADPKGTRTKQLLYKLNSDEEEEFLLGLDELEGAAYHSPLNPLYSAILSHRLVDKNDEISMKTWNTIQLFCEALGAQGLFVLFDNLLKFAQKNEKEIFFIDQVIRFNSTERVQASILSDFGIYSNQTQSYLDPIINHHFFPLKNSTTPHGCSSNELLFAHLEEKFKSYGRVVEKVSERWERFILPYIIDAIKNGTESKIEAAFALKDMRIVEAVSYKDELKRNGESIIQYVLGAKNANGYTIDTILDEFSSKPEVTEMVKKIREEA